MVDDDNFLELTESDQAKLDAIELEFERDGEIAFQRLEERDPVFYLRLVAHFHPKAVFDAVENAVIDAGLTNADIRAMMEKAIRERKH